MVKTPPARCDWCTAEPLYIEYHDHEWGIPVADETALFERLVLEGMQAGLSWWTILKKRARMKAQFYDFDIVRLANAGKPDIDSWMSDAGLIRHRGKLEAMVSNARCVAELDGGLSEFVWSFVQGRPIQNRWCKLSEVPTETVISKAMAKALKQAGFKFVGPTTCYAFMQSAGLVNDHLVACDAHAQCKRMGEKWAG